MTDERRYEWVDPDTGVACHINDSDQSVNTLGSLGETTLAQQIARYAYFRLASLLDQQREQQGACQGCADKDYGIEQLSFKVDRFKAQRAMTVARLGGEVEGAPTAKINYLQRVDELRHIESAATEAAKQIKNSRPLQALLTLKRALGLITPREELENLAAAFKRAGIPVPSEITTALAPADREEE